MLAAESAMGPERAGPAEIAWRGIELCRRGDWQEGRYWLSLAAEDKERQAELPGLFYAYLGYAVARYQRQAEHGLRLCRWAVDVELYQPESYYFLAETCLLAGDRREAVDVVERGLEVDSSHAGLVRLRARLGERRSPILPFLPRRHFVNRWLGRARHRVLGAGRS